MLLEGHIHLIFNFATAQNQGKKRSAPSGSLDAPTPTKKKRESTILRERYLTDAKSIEALGILLMNVCPTCGAKWLQTRQRGRGSALEMDIYCEAGHICTWSSIPLATEIAEKPSDSVVVAKP
jgi:hypothetical protein